MYRSFLALHLGFGVSKVSEQASISEPSTNVVEGLLAALILRPVVEQPGDRLVFVASVLQNQGRDAHQMRQIRDAGAVLLAFPPLPFLAPVEPERQGEGGGEAVSEN